MRPASELPPRGSFVDVGRIETVSRRYPEGGFPMDDRRYNGGVEPERDLLFEVLTPLGFWVRVARERWTLITTVKHPVTVGRELAVKQTLENPDEIRKSRLDAQVLLFYQAEGTNRWVCAVTKRADDHGFLITAYPTDAIKEGTRIWPK